MTRNIPRTFTKVRCFITATAIHLPVGWLQQFLPCLPVPSVLSSSCAMLTIHRCWTTLFKEEWRWQIQFLGNLATKSSQLKILRTIYKNISLKFDNDNRFQKTKTWTITLIHTRFAIFERGMLCSHISLFTFSIMLISSVFTFTFTCCHPQYYIQSSNFLIKKKVFR